MTYAEKLKHPKWQKKRLQVLNRDKFTCRDCGDKDRQLQVHHCFYETGEPWETDLIYLLTLCEKCHKVRGNYEKEAKREFSILLSKIAVQAIPNLSVSISALCSNTMIAPIVVCKGAHEMELFALKEFYEKYSPIIEDIKQTETCI